MVAEACQPDSSTTVSAAVHSQAVVLQQALHQIPSPSQEVCVSNFSPSFPFLHFSHCFFCVLKVVIRSISQRLATQLLEHGAQHLPNQSIITAIIR